MQRAIVALAGLLALSLLAGGAMAQSEERYRLERTEDGYVRMDTRTGAMTLCREQSGELVCRPAADRETSDDPQIEALRARLSALEARVDALEGEARTGVPLEEEFEQSLGLMERFFRRFVDIVRGLEEEQQQEQAPQGETPAPGRT